MLDEYEEKNRLRAPKQYLHYDSPRESSTRSSYGSGSPKISPKISSSTSTFTSKKAAAAGQDKTSATESLEGHEYWSSLGKPVAREKPQIKNEYGADRTSALESSEGAALWRFQNDAGPTAEQFKSKRSSSSSCDETLAIVPKLSRCETDKVTKMNSLLDKIKEVIYEKTKTLEEAFLKLDTDRSGFISRQEFSVAMSSMGFVVTEEEFDLINLTYPHHERPDEEDRGISYLEFLTMLTGKLTYVPGFGEEALLSPEARHSVRFRRMSSKHGEEHSGMWSSYLVDKRERELQLQSTFSKQVFDTFYTMKEAFRSIDRDNSGFIDAAELKEVLFSTFQIQATDEEIIGLMDRYDLNKDGKLAYNEFVKFLQVNDDMMLDI